MTGTLRFAHPTGRDRSKTNDRVTWARVLPDPRRWRSRPPLRLRTIPPPAPHTPARRMGKRSVPVLRCRRERGLRNDRRQFPLSLPDTPARRMGKAQRARHALRPRTRPPARPPAIPSLPTGTPARRMGKAQRARPALPPRTRPPARPPSERIVVSRRRGGLRAGRARCALPILRAAIGARRTIGRRGRGVARPPTPAPPHGPQASPPAPSLRRHPAPPAGPPAPTANTGPWSVQLTHPAPPPPQRRQNQYTPASRCSQRT
jgi:hypothetical protein